MSHCQGDVTVLRQACRVFMQMANMEVFLEPIIIASECNKVLRKQFLKPYIIDLILMEGYTVNAKFSKNTCVWLVYREKTEGHNGREYQLPDLSRFGVDSFCQDSGRCRTFSDVTSTGIPANLSVTTMRGDTLA